ncbi:MAG: hypothetical protein U1F57_11875 [bacterium]
MKSFEPVKKPWRTPAKGFGHRRVVLVGGQTHAHVREEVKFLKAHMGVNPDEVVCAANAAVQKRATTPAMT